MIEQLTTDSGSSICLLEEDQEKHISSIRNNFQLRLNTFYVLQALLLVLNIVIFTISVIRLYPTTQICERHLSSYSPATEILETTHTRRFDGRFDLKSIYKGTPNEGLDAAWDNITEIRLIGLSEDEIRAIGQEPELSVKFNPENKESPKIYAGIIEVFHQLHCLNLVRMMIYFEHYKNSEKILEVRDENLPHVDHCIDILRQALMCFGDVSVFTLKWVTFSDVPTPDFNTKHVCRDFRAIQQWNAENGVKTALFQKSKDIIEFDHYP